MSVSVKLTLMPRLVFAGLWDEFLAEGAWAFTLGDLVARTGSSLGSARVAVHTAMGRGVLASPARGVYVIIPAQEHRSGTVPVEAFINRLMAHLDRSYYLSYLTAAAHLAGDPPTTERFQVTVSAPTRVRAWQGTPIECSTDHRFPRRPTHNLDTRWGTLAIATPETLAYDLVTRPERAGGLRKAARIIAKLTLDPTELAAQTPARTQAASRRLGWLLDHHGHHGAADALDTTLGTRPPHPVTLDTTLGTRPPHPVTLDPRRDSTGPIDSRWHVRVNTSLAGSP